MTEHPDPWPLRHLVLRTPRLELRPEDDAGLLELVDLAHGGIHDPSWTPFLHPWTDAPPDELGPNTVRFFWSQRASLTPERWSVNFLVRVDGRVVGTQGFTAGHFAITREVGSGSWLGRAHQGRGYGWRCGPRCSCSPSTTSAPAPRGRRRSRTTRPRCG